MSWKAGLSRHLPTIRFFACHESPSSRGVINFWYNNFEELKALNPTMEIHLRTTHNASPAVVTDLEFNTDDLITYMIQHGKFKSTERIEAAKAFMKIDWDTIKRERWASPGFDPEKPFLEDEFPKWREDAKIATDLEKYLALKDEATFLEEMMKSGPDDEWEKSQNELIMCQRVDLWCAGENEVEMAVRHLYNLGKRLNNLEHDTEEFITPFYHGVEDFAES
mmetsp:Transcript_53559/g.64592  ORF Transcript_53559/g.64592 Transcript_53559/m.64592 type:complete len:222 (+) Transcript_53559:176-841(+)|eukprot:CAMPEP_0172504666 /NCGR_PEP_ID=MMETSP1066-20121228/180453_1 /TAXON_ID=671091 /ORGANISM="Coscinodiscus wailesii, Strain CCMP2513" /LENGTH=221 /DNA_ID=CAMNT_0013280941 /DNA_START=156 /DNA_END=821 /DNA_ORIENTATION=-